MSYSPSTTAASTCMPFCCRPAYNPCPIRIIILTPDTLDLPIGLKPGSVYGPLCRVVGSV